VQATSQAIVGQGLLQHLLHSLVNVHGLPRGGGSNHGSSLLSAGTTQPLSDEPAAAAQPVLLLIGARIVRHCPCCSPAPTLRQTCWSSALRLPLCLRSPRGNCAEGTKRGDGSTQMACGGDEGAATYLRVLTQKRKRECTGCACGFVGHAESQAAVGRGCLARSMPQLLLAHAGECKPLAFS
jgi:hypothetical protein